ncbi:MAG: glycosyltransferase [Eubacteriales bacterium]
MTNDRTTDLIHCSILESYTPFAEPELLDKIQSLAADLKGITVQHINSTYIGGGVAEILLSLKSIMCSVGLNARWDVIKADAKFFEVTKSFHNAFHGEKLNLNPEMINIYRQTACANLDLVAPDADFVVLHDQQPLGLTERRPGHQGKWIWYCHIDPVRVDARLWEFLSGYAGHCDAAIYHLAEYAKNLGHRQFFLPPAIDPLNEKNREVTAGEEQEVLAKLEISRDLPVILQVSRFDRLKNPFGVVQAFLEVAKEIPCRLILAGGAADDDPEGQTVLEELLVMVNNNPHIKVLNLAPTSNLEINVLQRAADIIVQNSVREGFGLTVTEALWKAKPVVATPVGGIRRQVLNEETGLLAGTPDELVQCLKRLLNNRGLAQELGRSGKEHVRKHFITPVYLYNWLLVLHRLHYGEEDNPVDFLT